MNAMRWTGVGLIVTGLGSFGLAWQMKRSDDENRRQAIAQSTYVQGTCTITEAEVIDFTSGPADDQSKLSTIEATFDVHSPKGDVKGARYRYSDRFWNTKSSRMAVASTHKPGASITCFYDAKDPSKAVLVRRGIPDEDGSNPFVLGAIIGVPLLLTGVMALFVKRRRPSTPRA